MSPESVCYNIGVVGKGMPISKFYSRLCRGGGMAVALFCTVFAVTSDSAAQSGQRALPVVSVSCDSDLKLCRALVSALAEVAPSHIYRINPTAAPSDALHLTFETNGSDGARLSWPGGATSATRQGCRNDVEFARHIVSKAGSALEKKLTKS